MARKRKAKKVKVGPLPPGWVRAATDGACMGNPGPMGLGGWLRDADDTVIAVFSVAAGEGTNNEAEFAAMAQAIELAAHDPVDRTPFPGVTGRVEDPEAGPVLAGVVPDGTVVPLERVQVVARGPLRDI